MPEITFVGRKKYIEQFKQLLRNPVGKPYILNLYAPGGFGKTKILQEFEKICVKENFPNTGIIDFYESELSSQINAVELVIAQVLSTPLSLEKGPFAEYWQARQVAEKARQVRDARYGVLKEKSKNQFITDLTSWAETVGTNGKGVLIFDTFEVVKNNQVGARLINDWLPVLKSAIVILSGRQQPEEIEFPLDVKNLVVNAPVGAFTKDEAKNYLKERRVLVDIKQDNVIDELLMLTQQQPLRLALSADRLDKYNFLTHISPAELVSGANRDDFEKKLVEDIVKDIRYPESLVLPAMAHVPRPFDAELINFLFPKKDVGEPKAILDNLSQLSFVKEIREASNSRYWFQDEVRTLLHKNVFLADEFTWKPIRQDISERMLVFYNTQIEGAEQVGNTRAIEQAIADRIYHEIYLTPEQKFSEVQRRFQAAREAYDVGLANTLLGAVRSAANSNFLNEEQKFSLSLMEARSLRDNGYIKLSEKQFLELLDEYRLEPIKAVFIYNGLGFTVEKLGKLTEALEYYHKSLQLSQELKLNGRLSLEKTNIGRVHQVMGNWEVARDNFKEAYELAMTYETDWGRIASILSELGHVYGLLGQYKVGVEYCSEAVQIWQDLNLSRLEAKGKILRGAVYTMYGLYEKAAADIQEAIRIYNTDADNNMLAEAYFYLGLNQWFQAEETDEEKLLKEAQESLENSILLSRQYNPEILPRALNQISNIYWEHDKDRARRTNDEAYYLADNVKDIRYIIDSLVGMAEFDYAEGRYENIPGYALQLRENFEDQGYKFPLFYGRMRRIQGDIAFEQKQYEYAINFYAEGLHLIAQHGGYGKYRIQQELKNLQEKLQNLPSEISLKFYRDLKEYWTQKDIDKGFPELISWVDRLISRLSFQMQSK